jgi:hypothetical protein
MLYLNDDFEGGPTSFCQESQKHYAAGDPNKVLYSFRPVRGDCLIFNSKICHDGGTVTAGLKYILRSEIMYQADSEDKVAYEKSRSCGQDHDPDVAFSWP